MGRIRSRIKLKFENWLYARFANRIDSTLLKVVKKDAWIKGYQACLQQYEFNYIPDFELSARYDSLKRSGKLIQVSLPR